MSHSPTHKFSLKSSISSSMQVIGMNSEVSFQKAELWVESDLNMKFKWKVEEPGKILEHRV